MKQPFAKSLQPFGNDHRVSLLAVATTSILYLLHRNCDAKKLRGSMYIYACPKVEMLLMSSVMYVSAVYKYANKMSYCLGIC